MQTKYRSQYLTVLICLLDNKQHTNNLVTITNNTDTNHSVTITVLQYYNTDAEPGN